MTRTKKGGKRAVGSLRENPRKRKEEEVMPDHVVTGGQDEQP